MQCLQCDAEVKAAKKAEEEAAKKEAEQVEKKIKEAEKAKEKAQAEENARKKAEARRKAQEDAEAKRKAELEAEETRKQEEAEKRHAEEQARQEAILSHLEDDSSSDHDVSAQNKQIASIMRDQHLSAVEKQLRTQAIRAGKIHLPSSASGQREASGVSNQLPWQPPGRQPQPQQHQQHRQQHQQQQQQQQQQQHYQHHQQQQQHQHQRQQPQHHSQGRDAEADLDVDVQAFALNINSLTGFTEDEQHMGMDDVMAMALGGHSSHGMHSGHAHDKQSYMPYAPFGVGGNGGGSYGGASAGGPAGSRLFGGGPGLSGMGGDLCGGGGMGMGNGGGGAAGSRLFERWGGMQGSDSEENFTEASMASTASGTRTPLNLDMDDIPGSPEMYSESMANACALSALDFRQPHQSRLMQQGMQQQRGQPAGKNMQKKPGFSKYQTNQ